MAKAEANLQEEFEGHRWKLFRPTDTLIRYTKWYYCGSSTRLRGCPKTVQLRVDNNDETAIIFVSKDDHSHSNIISKKPYGIDKKKEKIKEYEFSHV